MSIFNKRILRFSSLVTLIFAISFLFSNTVLASETLMIIVLCTLNTISFLVCSLCIFKYRLSFFNVIRVIMALILLNFTIILIFLANASLLLGLPILLLISTVFVAVLTYITTNYFVSTSKSYMSLWDSIACKTHVPIVILNGVFAFLILLFLPAGISSIYIHLALVTFIFISWMYLLYIIWKNINMLNFNISIQLSIVLGYIALFWNSAALSPYTQKGSFLSMLYMVAGLIMFNVSFLLSLYICIKTNTFKSKKNALSFIKDNPFIIAIVLYLSLCLFDVKVNSIFDSAIYFSRVASIPSAFNFIPQQTFRLMQVIAHTSGAFTSYYLLSHFFVPYNVIITNIQSYFIMIFAIIAFEKILNYFFTGPSYKWQRMLGCAIFAFTPTVYSGALQVNADFFIGTFMIMMIASIIYKKNILGVFFGIFMIYSKTTGIVVYFAFCFGLLFVDFVFNLLNKKKPVDIISDFFKKYWQYLIPFFAFGVWLIVMRNHIWSFPSAGAAVAQLGVKTAKIRDVIMQLFAVNFNWVIYSIVLLSIAFTIYRIKVNKSTVTKKQLFWLCIIVITFLGYALFNALYTSSFKHARYIIPCYMLTALILFFAIQLLIKNKIFKILLLALVFSLSFTSTFITYDPVLLKVFPYFESDGVKYSLYNSSVVAQSKQMTDISLYNREYVYIDKLNSEFINTVNFESEDIAIFIDVRAWNMQFTGNGEIFSYAQTQDGRKIATYDENTPIKSLSFSHDEFASYENLPAEAYFIRPWYQDESVLNYVEDIYEIKEYICIQKGNYLFHAYKIIRKQA